MSPLRVFVSCQKLAQLLPPVALGWETHSRHLQAKLANQFQVTMVRNEPFVLKSVAPQLQSEGCLDKSEPADCNSVSGG